MGWEEGFTSENDFYCNKNRGGRLRQLYEDVILDLQQQFCYHDMTI